LALAAGAFGGWAFATGDAGRALAVTAAVLIVTCPCALGIATPLAYELAQAGLRRHGLYVRAGGFLDRAAAGRRGGGGQTRAAPRRGPGPAAPPAHPRPA